MATTLFTDDPLVAGTTVIKAAHIVELRMAVDAVRRAAGLTDYGAWTYSPPTGPVTAADNVALRTALDQAAEVILLHGIGYAAGTPLVNGMILAVHYQEIREAVK